jgi:hypothetical protein
MARRWILLIALMLVLIGAIASAGIEGWRAIDDRIDRLEAELQALPRLAARVEKLEARIAPLEARADGSELAQQALGEGQRANTLLAGLEARILALETKGPSPALEARVAALEQTTTHGQDAERVDQDRATALSSLILVQAIDRGAPFQAELAALRRMTKNDAVFSDLAPAAAEGILRRDQLIAQFEDTARAVLNARETPPTAEAWWQRLLDHARKLIIIRQTTPLPGDEPVAIVSRAEGALGGGRLDAAVDELQSLKGASADAAASWLGKARMRLLAESEIAAFTADLVAQSNGLRK